MALTAVEVFKKAVAEQFSFLKGAENVQEAYLRAIPIEKSGFLVPLSKAHASDEDLMRKLTEWRNTYVEVYPTQFTATLESTKAWFKDRLFGFDPRSSTLGPHFPGAGHAGTSSLSRRNPLAWMRKSWA